MERTYCPNCHRKTVICDDRGNNPTRYTCYWRRQVTNACGFEFFDTEDPEDLAKKEKWKKFNYDKAWSTTE